MKKAELKAIITGHIHGKLMDGSIKPDSAPDLITFIGEAIDNRDQELVNDIADLVRQWEQAMGSEDTTLYTLGLRRIIDLIRDDSHKPTAPVDHRDFKRGWELPDRDAK